MNSQETSSQIKDQVLVASFSPEKYRELLSLANASGFETVSDLLAVRIAELLGADSAANAHEANGWLH